MYLSIVFLDPNLFETHNYFIMNSTIDPIEKQNSWKMFNRIASTYDTLNSILSLGILTFWRKSLVNEVPKRRNMKILDCATGTGEVMFSIMKLLHKQVAHIIGIDLANGMMDLGRDRSKGFDYKDKLEFKQMSATDIAYDNDSFDCVTMAFGIRNVDDPQKCLKEIYRVLKPEGRVLIMEFSLPKNICVKWGYLIYFRYILPFIGGLISGDFKAYKYLNKSVESFPYGDKFVYMMNRAGFTSSFSTLSLGIAMLYIGEKRNDDSKN